MIAEGEGVIAEGEGVIAEGEGVIAEGEGVRHKLRFRKSKIRRSSYPKGVCVAAGEGVISTLWVRTTIPSV